MAIIVPVRFVLAALVLAVGYGWVLFLFGMGVMLGMASFVMLPLYMVSVPPIVSATHRLAGALLPTPWTVAAPRRDPRAALPASTRRAVQHA